MAKIKRIALSIRPEVDAVISALSKATNTPKTAIINGLIEEAFPVFQQAVNTLEQIKQGQQAAAVQSMTDFLGNTSMILNQAHLELGEWKGKINDK